MYEREEGDPIELLTSPFTNPLSGIELTVHELRFTIVRDGGHVTP